jgi:NAD+ diphosphatase
MTTEVHGRRVVGMGRSAGALAHGGALRADVDAVGRRLSDPRSCLLVLGDGDVPVTRARDGTTNLAFADPTALGGDGMEPILLGVDESDRAIFAVGRSPAVAGEAEQMGLRQALVQLEAAQAELLLQAAGLLNWHTDHGFCSRCGATTVPELAGARRRCTRDGSLHFPRTDPAVIVAVVDAEDRLLLAQHLGPRPAPSTLAGFVEPGESLESAVAREVREECGLVIAETGYVGSQPWPFPSSLMVGFCARSVTAAITVDGTEISAAAWYTRPELEKQINQEGMRLSPLSISSLLIDLWRRGSLPLPPVA